MRHAASILQQARKSRLLSFRSDVVYSGQFQSSKTSRTMIDCCTAPRGVVVACRQLVVCHQPPVILHYLLLKGSGRGQSDLYGTISEGRETPYPQSIDSDAVT